MSLPIISLVGRPNVGKSTIFNRLSKSRQALVSDFSGLTRDRQYADISLSQDSKCTIVDTGGLTNEDNNVDNEIQKQILIALDESDVIYFIISAIDGITALDLDIATKIRKFKKNILLVCNKAENLSINDGGEFYELGFGEPILISAEHAQGMGYLIDKTVELLPIVEEEITAPEGTIVLSVLGKPNVGKSTLINRMLGEERVLVIDMPGTTRDSIHIPFVRDEQKYTLIDTAGIRRKNNVHDKIEKFSIIKAIDALEKSHVVILMLDAHIGVTEQDATLLGMITDKYVALIIVINKWDGLDHDQKQEVRRKLDLKLSFVKYASVHYISALHGSGVGKLFAPIQKSYANAGQKFPTSLLNNILAKANAGHQPPAVKGVRAKIKYLHQSDTFPPTFTLHGNHLNNIPTSYERYLKNFFISALKISNTPIKFAYKSADNPFKDKKNQLTNRQINKKRRLMKFTKSRK